MFTINKQKCTSPTMTKQLYTCNGLSCQILFLYVEQYQLISISWYCYWYSSLWAGCSKLNHFISSPQDLKI